MAQGARNANSSHFGRQAPYVRRGFCDHCGTSRNLYSYDTVDFFALGRLPLAPHRKLRVLDECERCKFHTTITKKDWNRERKAQVEDVRRALDADPGNAELAAKLALGLATFQDEAGFDASYRHLHRTVSSSAESLQTLAAVLGVFGRRAEATELYREAFELEDTRQSREALAASLALGLEPREARALLDHLLGPSDPEEEAAPAEAEEVSEAAATEETDPSEDDPSDADSAEAADDEPAGEASAEDPADPDEPLFSEEEANVVFLVAQSAQAKGEHALALELFESLEAAIPGADLSEPRALSTATQEGQEVPSPAFAPRPSDAGPTRGVGLKAYLTGPALLLLAIGCYLGLSHVMGQGRQVHLINGLRRPYSVSLNGGKPILLAPNTRQVTKVPEGRVTVSVTGEGVEIPEFSEEIETPFLFRPFLRPTFVINPDRCAVLIHQKITYSTRGDTNPPPTLLASGRVYDLNGIDYVFSTPPTTIRVQGDSSVQREALRQSVFRDPQERLLHVRSFLGDPGAKKWLEDYLAADPEQADLLFAYCNLVKKKEAIAYLRRRLGDRPVRVTWHRVYQDLSGGAGNTELEEEYRALVADEPEAGDHKYLLARVLLDDAEIKPLRKSALSGPSPSPYALMVKGYRDMSQAKHEEALATFERALAMKDSYLLRYARDLALVSLGRFDQLINRLSKEFFLRPHSFELASRLIRYQVAQGDSAAAAKTSSTCQNAWHGLLPTEGLTHLRKSLQRALSYARGDLTTFVNSCGEEEAFQAQVAARDPKAALAAFRKQSDAAFKERNEAEDPDELADTSSGDFFSLITVLVLANHTGDGETASQVLDQLLAQTPPPPSPDAERVLIALREDERGADHEALLALEAQPLEKRLLLTLLGQRFPEQRARYYALVRQLNAPLDFPHHLIREVTSAPK